MSKATKSNLWFARFDGEKEWLKARLTSLAGCIDIVEILGVYHQGDKKNNPHTHFVFQSSNKIQKQSMAIRLKKLFGLEDKSRDYSLDVWDGDKEKGATGYLFHEAEAEVLVNKGFSEANMANAKLANEAVQRVVALNKEKTSKRLVDKALEHFSAQRPSRQELLCFFARRIREGENHYPGDFMLKRYVEEVELRLKDDNEIGRWAWALENNLWR